MTKPTNCVYWLAIEVSTDKKEELIYLGKNVSAALLEEARNKLTGGWYMVSCVCTNEEMQCIEERQQARDALGAANKRIAELEEVIRANSMQSDDQGFFCAFCEAHTEGFTDALFHDPDCIVLTIPKEAEE